MHLNTFASNHFQTSRGSTINLRFNLPVSQPLDLPHNQLLHSEVDLHAVEDRPFSQHRSVPPIHSKVDFGAKIDHRFPQEEAGTAHFQSDKSGSNSKIRNREIVSEVSKHRQVVDTQRFQTGSSKPVPVVSRQLEPPMRTEIVNRPTFISRTSGGNTKLSESKSSQIEDVTRTDGASPSQTQHSFFDIFWATGNKNKNTAFHRGLKHQQKFQSSAHTSQRSHAGRTDAASSSVDFSHEASSDGRLVNHLEHSFQQQLFPKSNQRRTFEQSISSIGNTAPPQVVSDRRETEFDSRRSSFSKFITDSELAARISSSGFDSTNVDHDSGSVTYVSPARRVEITESYLPPHATLKPILVQNYLLPLETSQPKIEHSYLPPTATPKPQKLHYLPAPEQTYFTPSATPKPNIVQNYLPPVATQEPKIDQSYLPPSLTPKPKIIEYLPPVDTQESKIEQSYLPPSTTPKPKIIQQYLPPVATPEPKIEQSYLPPSTTPKPKIIDYLPPVDTQEPKIEQSYLPPSTTPKLKIIQQYLPPVATPEPKIEQSYLPPSTTLMPKIVQSYLSHSTTPVPKSLTNYLAPPASSTPRFVQNYLPPSSASTPTLSQHYSPPSTVPATSISQNYLPPDSEAIKILKPNQASLFLQKFKPGHVTLSNTDEDSRESSFSAFIPVIAVVGNERRTFEVPISALRGKKDSLEVSSYSDYTRSALTVQRQPFSVTDVENEFEDEHPIVPLRNSNSQQSLFLSKEGHTFRRQPYTVASQVDTHSSVTSTNRLRGQSGCSSNQGCKDSELCSDGNCVNACLLAHGRCVGQSTCTTRRHTAACVCPESFTSVILRQSGEDTKYDCMPTTMMTPPRVSHRKFFGSSSSGSHSSSSYSSLLPTRHCTVDLHADARYI